MRVFYVLLAMTFLFVVNIHAQKVKKVLFIGVDGVRGDAYVHRLAQDYLRNETADATVVYYADPDIAGHTNGFTNDNPGYYGEIVQFDRYVGDLMDAINAPPSRANEEWLIVSTSDHGGFETWHGGEHLSERNVFVVVARDDMEAKEIKRSNTITIKPEDALPVAELEKYGFQDVPTTFDIAPTILHFLDIETSGYNFDGKSLLK